MDSVINSNYEMYYRSDQLRLDLSVLFSTDPSLRWSIYTGLGLNAGRSFKAETTINYNIYRYAEPNWESNYHNINASYTYETETFQGKNNFGFSAYIPLGIDFRIWKNSKLLNYLHLFYEARPGITRTVIPETCHYTNATLQQNLGIRIEWI